MIKIKKYLMVGGFILMSIGLWMSGIFATEVTVGSKNFDLGAVQGVWDQNSQSLTLQGNGKIDRNKWFQLVNELQLRQFSVSKIEFMQGVQFPDNASSFFQDFKTENIIFPNGMDTSNVTNMDSMFESALNFNGGNISDWDVSKVKNFYETFRWAGKFNQDLSRWNTESATTMNSMFQGTRELTKPVNFENVSKVTDMGLMFHASGVPSVNLKKTGKVQQMHNMFNDSKVETVTLDDTSSVENMDSMFESALNFNGGNISDWDVSKVKNFYETFRWAGKFNQDLSRWNTESATTMNSMFQGTRELTKPVNFENVSKVTDMGLMFHASGVPSVNLKKTGKVQQMHNMFNDSKVETVTLDDTSSVENMDSMFESALNFNGGNISDWDVSKVKNFYETFRWAGKFNQDLSRWNTESATTMNSMFQGTRELTKPVNFENVSKVTDMGLMFHASGVPSVNLKKTGKVQQMHNMFNDSKVETVTLDDTSSVENMDSMFESALNFNGGNISDWDVSKVKNFYETFRWAGKFNQDLSRWNTESATTMNSMFQGTRELTKPVNFENVSKVTDMGLMFHASGVPSVNLKKTGKVQQMHNMFNDSKVETVTLDDTSSVENMDSMFESALNFNGGNISDWDVSKVKNFYETFRWAGKFNQDLSRWNTESATTMNSMFQGTRELTKPVNFENVSKVTDMGLMFHASGVPSVNLKKTGKVQQMHNMFNDSKVETVTLDDTSSVENMDSMFESALNFNGGNISDWDVSKVKNFYETFRWAGKFNQDLSRWNTESATTMNSMFQGTRELTKPVNFENVSKVTDMGLMFHASGVPSVNLKKTGKVQQMHNMFNDSKVETVTLDDTSSVENMDSMFESALNFNGGNISDWDVSKVKNFYETFRWAGKFNQDLSRWNTESATTMNSMFQGASNFNADISNWNIGSLKDANGLIWNTNSFSQDNYESFLQTLAKSNISPKAMGKVIHVSATYCAQASLRNKLIARGFDLKDNGLDCQIKFDYTRPTLSSSGDIKDTTIKVSAKLPLDPANITIDGAATTILYKDFNCKKGDTENQVLCSIIFTGTNKGNKLSLKASMNVPISNWKRTPGPTDQDPGTYTETTTTQLVEKTDSINGYIIDRIAPDKAQFTINTKKGIHNPVIRLANLPNDAGIGLDYCVMKTDDDTDYGTEKLKANTDYSLTLKSQETHSIWVKCYDKVGNHSENEVRFPPIVTFSEENRVLIKDGNITGEVKIYAPLNQNGSENLIDRVWVENSNGSNVNIVSCRDYNGKTNMQGNAKFNNTPDKPLTCRFEGKFPEGKDSHDVQVKAQAANGAIGWNTQTFTRDEQGPEIIITPQSAFTGKNFTFEVRVFDAIGIVANGVKLDTDTSPEFKDGKLSCKPLSEGNQNTIICTGTTNIEEGKSIENGKISILARDKAGNETKLAYTNYTIDRQKPSIFDLTFDYKEGTHQQTYKGSVNIQDQGPAGLWKSSEAYSPSALSYGVGDDEKCTNYRSISALNPGETEPYTLGFDFSDQNSNGKYLCIKAEDKVGNVAFLAHNDPVKVNLPPMIADGQKFTLPEHHHDREKNVKEIGEIHASDPNNDDLTYEIVGEDMNKLFEFKGNRLQTKPGVELDFEKTLNYLVKVRVVDKPGLASKEGEIQISLTDIDEILPTVDPILDQRIKKNREVSIPVNATDAGGIRNIQVSGLPKGLFYNSKTKKIEGSTEERVRDQEVIVTVTDKEGNTISQKFQLTVAGSQRDDNSTTGPQCFGDCSVKDHSKTQEKPSQSLGDSEINKKQQLEEKKVEKSEEKLVHHTEADIFNPTISDGQCYTRRPLHPIIDSDSIITSEEFKKAQSFLRSYEMTMFDSVDKYAPTRNLSRQEAAKMFSNFAINVLCRKPDLNLKVNYSDVKNTDPTLKPYITLAYQLGVMKGSGMGDGKFRPFDQISKAEVNAVLIRMILKSYLDESKSENKTWYSEYNKVATELGIINRGAGAEKISRNNTALMLFRAYKQQVFEWKNIDYFSYVLQSRDLFVR